MTYLQIRLAALRYAFPDVPIEALKAGMIEGIEAYAWMKEGVYYVGTCGTTRREAVQEIVEFK